MMLPDFDNQNLIMKNPGESQIFGPNFEIAFGALAVAVTRAEQTGDFSECRKIIDMIYVPPLVFIQEGPNG